MNKHYVLVYFEGNAARNYWFETEMNLNVGTKYVITNEDGYTYVIPVMILKTSNTYPKIPNNVTMKKIVFADSHKVYENMKDYANQMRKLCDFFNDKDHNIERVIYSGDKTVVLWKSGDKTVVKCGDGDVFDKEKGLFAAIIKYLCGNMGSELNKLIDTYASDQEPPINSFKHAYRYGDYNYTLSAPKPFNTSLF